MFHKGSQIFFISGCFPRQPLLLLGDHPQPETGREADTLGTLKVLKNNNRHVIRQKIIFLSWSSRRAFSRGNNARNQSCEAASKEHINNEKREQMVIFFLQKDAKMKIPKQVLSLKLLIVMGISWIFEFVHFLIVDHVYNLDCFLLWQVAPKNLWLIIHFWSKFIFLNGIINYLLQFQAISLDSCWHVWLSQHAPWQPFLPHLRLQEVDSQPGLNSQKFN